MADLQEKMEQEEPTQVEEKAEKDQVNPVAAPAGSKKRKVVSKKATLNRETRTVGQFYQWNAESDLLNQFKPSFGEQDFEELSKEILTQTKEFDVTLEDVLQLPANVMNQREVEKVRHIIEKYAELRENGRAALANLIASAQVNAKQREAKSLKKKLVAERKARKENKD